MTNIEFQDRFFSSGRYYDEITKYPPEGYCSDRYFIQSEWEDISDIGKSYNGRVLSEQEYLSIEQQHVNVIIDLFNASGCRKLKMYYWPNDNIIDPKKEWPLYEQNRQLIKEWMTRLRFRTYIGIEDIPTIARLCLRQYGYVLLGNLKRGLYIRFGECMYITFRSKLFTNQLNSIAKNHHLYYNPRGRWYN